MRIISLTIKKGLFENKFEFPAHVNIIHSDTNSVGKTTLLRFIIYALGYKIPNTKGIDFGDYELLLKVIGKEGHEYLLCRERDWMTIEYRCERKDYTLPFDLNTIHSQLFGIANNEVLDNLLGAYYIDQEKGWTLLNRGKVIGSIHFSIEGLIRGLSGRSSDGLADRLSMVKRELQKHRQMFDTAKYQAEINELGENIAYDTPTDEIEEELDILACQRQPLYEEYRRIESVIRKNTSFSNYVTSMKLLVRSDTGIEIPVNESTIVGFLDNVEFLATKRKMVADQVAQIDRKIKSLNHRHEKEMSLFDVQSSIQAFDANISKMNIDAHTTERIIGNLNRERRSLEIAIIQSVKQNNPLIAELHALISGYAQELGVYEKYVSASSDYIFTSDLKSLSGAIFHKIVFAFKMAYIKIISRHTGTILPIILDSPSGREVDKINVEDMMNILMRDFSDHQIIIASIYIYNFPEINILELKEKLLT